EGVALELLAVSACLVREWTLFVEVHLPVQDVHARRAERRGFVDHGFDRHLGRFEMPIQVGQNPEFNPRMSGVGFVGGAQCESRAGERRRPNELSAIQHIISLDEKFLSLEIRPPTRTSGIGHSAPMSTLYRARRRRWRDPRASSAYRFHDL